MDHEALKNIITKNMKLYRSGLIMQDDIEYLDMIIAAHELLNADDSEAHDLTWKLTLFMKETDGIRPLHYSLWLALFPLHIMKLPRFLESFEVQALKEDYQPDNAVMGIFHNRLETKVTLPLSVHSELIREEVDSCLAQKDHISAALQRWMAYEDELARRRNSFEIGDVLSVYYSYTSEVLNMDAFEHAQVSSECILKISIKDMMHEIPVLITHVYDDMITALSFARPLHLYRIFRNEAKAECYKLSDREYLGFHVGMLLADDVEINEKNIRARLMDPAGGRYEVSGKIIQEYPNQVYGAEITFADGTKKKAEFCLSERHFAMIELSQGYSDFLKDYR